MKEIFLANLKIKQTNLILKKIKLMLAQKAIKILIVNVGNKHRII